jgi:hypothetical protein
VKLDAHDARERCPQRSCRGRRPQLFYSTVISLTACVGRSTTAIFGTPRGRYEA